MSFLKRHQPNRPSLSLERGVTLLYSLRPGASSNPTSPDPNSTSFSPRVPSPRIGFSSPRTPLLPGPGWPPLSLRAGRARRRTRNLLFPLLLAVAMLFWLFYPIPSPNLSFLLYSSPHVSRAPLIIPPSPWPPDPRTSPHTHYLTYHPHSGFHNQRIALENALVLASLLNRTLLVPPARLGEAVRYMETPKLHRHLAFSSKVGLSHCRHFPANTAAADLPEECDTYYTYGHVHFASLVSLPPPTLVPYIPLPGPILSTSHLSDLSLTSSDIYSFPDTQPYQYRFFESALSTRPLGPRYATRIDLPDLRAASQHARLLELGTLFGTARIKLQSDAAKRTRRAIREAMTVSHPLLLQVASAVTSALGGQDAYIGAHVRLGDGNFERDGPLLVRLVWWALVRALKIPEDDAVQLEAWAHNVTSMPPPPPSPEPDRAALRAPYPPLPPYPSGLTRLQCPSPPHTHLPYHPLNSFLFLATPSSTHPLLLPLLRTFPCTFTLSSFPRLLAPLSGSIEDADGVPLDNWLLAFVDGLVVSSARDVVGTRGSTFSRWVEDVAWRRAHRFDIVDRG